MIIDDCTYTISWYLCHRTRDCRRLTPDNTGIKGNATYFWPPVFRLSRSKTHPTRDHACVIQVRDFPSHRRPKLKRAVCKVTYILCNNLSTSSNPPFSDRWLWVSIFHEPNSAFFRHWIGHQGHFFV